MGISKSWRTLARPATSIELMRKSLPASRSRRSVDARTRQRLPLRSISFSAICCASCSRSGSISTSANVPSSSPSTCRMSVINCRANTVLPAPRKVMCGIANETPCLFCKTKSRLCGGDYLTRIDTMLRFQAGGSNTLDNLLLEQNIDNQDRHNRDHRSRHHQRPLRRIFAPKLVEHELHGKQVR